MVTSTTEWDYGSRQEHSNARDSMKITPLFVIFSLLACSVVHGQTSQPSNVVKIYVQGDSSRLSDFVQECRTEFADHGLKLQLVPFDGDFDYNIVIAQESALGGAAASVIALDRKGLFVASVVRSGRMSGKGALNASAKELAKKLAVLSAQ
jgi:hypothetical protein